MKKMYSTKMINTGGRSGEVHSPDHSFELAIAAPGRRVADATNPEQLFAAGFSACFNSALELIKNQKNSLCISQCKAFEEVVDTQMYGFSQQVGFAVRVGIIDKTEGQLLLSELERELNRLYSEVYQENYDKKEIGKEE